MYSEHTKLKRLPVAAKRELFKGSKNFHKNRVMFKHFIQALSGTSKLQWSSCNTNHDEHLGTNTKE